MTTDITAAREKVLTIMEEACGNYRAAIKFGEPPEHDNCRSCASDRAALAEYESLIRAEAGALVAALREDARRVHIVDHHQTRKRIPFEECPSAFCELRRELLAKYDTGETAR